MVWPLIRLIDDVFVYLRHSEYRFAVISALIAGGWITCIPGRKDEISTVALPKPRRDSFTSFLLLYRLFGGAAAVYHQLRAGHEGRFVGRQE